MKTHLFFPNLNGIRFIAALMVVLHHIEQTKRYFKIPNLYSENIHGVALGGLGVTLFFNLSGFLITYLLLTERSETASINLKNFYIRRVLRIWPLYFLVVTLAFFVLYNIEFFRVLTVNNFWYSFIFYILIIPNFLISSIMPFASQCWSIGVEEQFYIFWPVLIKHTKNFIKVFLILILFFVFLNLLTDLFLKNYISSNILVSIRILLSQSRFDCMIVGAFFAYYLHSRRESKIIRFLFRKDIQMATYICLAFMLYKMPIFTGLGHLPYSLVFTVLIINLAANNNTVISLENSILNYLGKISYGIYMLHPIVVFASVKLIALNATSFNIKTLSIYNAYVYSISTIGAILLAAISYSLFEKRILSFKKYYSVIISGDHAREFSNKA